MVMLSRRRSRFLPHNTTKTSDSMISGNLNLDGTKSRPCGVKLF